jgi:MATE family multidrug resistance protein
MNFADTVMAGRLSARDLAAVAVGGSVWMVAFLFALGMLMALSPTVAHSYGAGKEKEVGAYLRQGLWLSLVMAIVILLLISQAGWFLRFIGIDADILPVSGGYLTAIVWGAPGITAYLALRFCSEGIGWTRPIMYMAAIGLVFNVIGNYVLMYGKLGFPAMGAVGCGWASAISMWLMFFSMLVYTYTQPVYRRFELLTKFDWPDRKMFYPLLALGTPIALSVVAEAGLFSAVALLMGTLGGSIVAAHQIAINYASMMFMIPLAMHSATTIHIGHALGRGDRELARYRGFVGIGLCTSVMVVSAIIMLLFKHNIVLFYTRDTMVYEIAVSLILMAAIFQVSDGLQVGAAGALRGFKDTKIPMFLNIFSYWVIGFPLAYYLGIVADRGPASVWVGLIVGLTVCAVLLGGRFLAISRVSPSKIAV